MEYTVPSQLIRIRTNSRSRSLVQIHAARGKNFSSDSFPMRPSSRSHKVNGFAAGLRCVIRSEEHTSELQSHHDLHSSPTRRSSDLSEFDAGITPHGVHRTVTAHQDTYEFPQSIVGPDPCGTREELFLGQFPHETQFA